MDFPLVSYLTAFTQVYDTGGENFYIDCPVCKGYKKCGVHRTKMLFHCFKCDEGGHGGRTWSGRADLLGFVKIVEGLSTRDARSFLNTLQGIPDQPMPERTTRAPSKTPTGTSLSQLYDTHVAVKYLTRRHLGHLRASASFVENHDLYSDRIIFPTRHGSTSTGFEARTVLDWVKPKALYPEWQNTVDVYTNLNWDLSSRVVVVAESLIDAETFNGISNAVGTYGVFTGNQLDSLLRLDPSEVVWAMDGDMNHRLEEFVKYTLGIIPTSILRLGPNEDPNSIGPHECSKRFNNRVRINTLWDLYDLALD